MVAERDGQIVGSADIELIRDDDFGELPFLKNVLTEPEARHTGVATILITHIVETMARAGYEYVYLSVLKSNKPARKLYEKLGFVEVYGNDNRSKSKYLNRTIRSVVQLMIDECMNALIYPPPKLLMKKKILSATRTRFEHVDVSDQQVLERILKFS